MEAMETFLHNVDFVRESLTNLYDALQARISGKKLVIPLSGVVVFYVLYVRQVEGKKRKLILKEPCRPDEEYTGDEYPSVDLDLPILDNWLVISICRKLYRTLIGTYLLQRFQRKGHFHLPCGEIPELPTFFPLETPSEDLLKKKQITDSDLREIVKKSKDGAFHFNTISDFVMLYRNKEATPSDIAKKIVQFIKEADKAEPKIKAIIKFDEDDIMKQAEESTERWRSGKILSVFDGVPVAVKDEYIVGGYPTRNGLPISMNDRIYDVSEERGLVKRLRDGGAIIIGITNMHQIGIGTFGINQSKYHGTSRNPYNTDYSTSGSSGGSASVIAAGFCPVALGTDGGGSIRLPAGVCGVVGLKATYGRYTTEGMLCNALTVGHAGPLCATVRDTAISYGFMAGKDFEDWKSLLQPPVFVGDFEATDLTGIRIGFDPVFLETCHPEIRTCILKAINWLKTKHNATLVQIHFPEKEETYRALAKVITSEMAHVNDHVYCNHYDDLNVDVISSLKMGRYVTAHEYLACQRQRTRSMNALKYIFSHVDAIITPLFAAYQPFITPSREKYGYSNLNLTVNISKFCLISNLTGTPAISLPVDYSPSNGLPISAQIMAPWWREDILLRTAYAIESNVQIRRPQVFYDIL